MISPAKTTDPVDRQEKDFVDKDTPHHNGSGSNLSPSANLESECQSSDYCAPRVAVLVDTSSEWGRQLVQGINSYAVKNGPWKLWVATRGLFQPGNEDRLNLPDNWNGDGIITPLTNDLTVQKLSEYEKRIVNVSAENLISSQIPHVTSNVDAVAAMSLEHFNLRGIKNFAYVGPLQNAGVARHAAAFQGRVEQAGFQCQMFDCVYDRATPHEWNDRRSSMTAWLRLLPKPVGIFSWQTNAAIQVLDVCTTFGISVPDDVSVLAGDDDSLLCNTTTPTLSGVVTASEQIGFAAARKLDQIMHGQVLPDQEGPELVDPIMVKLRQSTDSLAIADRDLLAAVRYIRQHACRRITVQEVADSVPIGRRSLERKFKECFGRTPLDEIQRLRLFRVRELLVKTDLPVSKIAQETGFGTPEYMTTMFKCRFGLTPLKFRSKSRAR